MKRLAVGSWAYVLGPYRDKPVSFHSLLHRLEDAGFAGVELGCFAPHPMPDTYAARDKRDHLRKEVAAHGLALSGLVPDFGACRLLSGADCDPYVAAFEKNLQFAASLGIDLICVDTAEPVTAAGLDPRQVFDRVVEAFDRCSKLAAARGSRVCWEFDPGQVLHRPEEIVAVVEAVRARHNPNFSVLFDSCNAHLCGEAGAVALLRQLHGKIGHVHLADSDGTPAHLPPGKGRLNWDQLIPELLQAGVGDDWWVVDLGLYPDAVDSTRDSKRFLDRLRQLHGGA